MQQKEKAQAAIAYMLEIIEYIETNPIDSESAYMLLKNKLPMLNEVTDENENETILEYLLVNKDTLKHWIDLKKKIHYFREGFNLEYKEIMTMLDVSRPTVSKYLKEPKEEVYDVELFSIQKLEWLYYEINKLVHEPKPYPFLVL